MGDTVDGVGCVRGDSLADGFRDSGCADVAVSGEGVVLDASPNRNGFDSDWLALAEEVAGTPDVRMGAVGAVRSPVYGGLDVHQAQAWRDLVSLYSWHVPTIERIITCESQWIATAMNPSGARGLLQIMPVHADKLAEVTGLEHPDLDLLFVPEINIEVGWLVFVASQGFSPWNASRGCW